jgi:Catalase
MSLEEVEQTQSPLHYPTHWLDHCRQYFIGRDLAWNLAARSQGRDAMKTHFGINVDDDHTCLERLLEVFVAGSRADAAQCRINTLDVTKVSSHRDYPLFTVGRIALDRNPKNYFAGSLESRVQ